MLYHKDNPLVFGAACKWIILYVADGAELRSAAVWGFHKLKMYECKSQFRIRFELFRKYRCVSSSPKISSSASLDPQGESRADSRENSRPHYDGTSSGLQWPMIKSNSPNIAFPLHLADNFICLIDFLLLPSPQSGAPDQRGRSCQIWT